MYCVFFEDCVVVKLCVDFVSCVFGFVVLGGFGVEKIGVEVSGGIFDDV